MHQLFKCGVQGMQNLPALQFETSEAMRRGRRADARQELQRAPGGEAVLRVVRPAQHREEILDVRRLEELEAAVLHIRDIPPHQLQLEHIGVVRAAEQHRLALQRDACFPVFQNPGNHVARLRRVVRHGDVARLVAFAFARDQAFPCQRIGGVQDGLRRAVIVFEGYHRCLVRGRKIPDVLNRRGPKRINRLRVVAHHRHALAARAQALQDLRLQHVGVLVFVDQDVVERPADLGREALVGHHRVPVEQQVVVVERLVLELSLHVIPEQPAQLFFPFRAPGKHGRKRGGERTGGVHAVRVDREAGVLAREALLGLRQTEVVAHHVHHVGRVAAVEHAEARVEPDARGVPADQAVRDRVEGARPGQPHVLRHFADDALRPPRHFERRASREGEEQDALRRGALENEVRDAVRERVGLAGARAGEDQQRPVAEARRFALPVI